MRNLRNSVQDMLAEMRQNREEATTGTRERLQEYMEDLHATVAGAMNEADEELREFARLRQEAAHELAQNARRRSRRIVRKRTAATGGAGG